MNLLLWILFGLYAFVFLIGFLMFLLLDDEKRRFAGSMEILAYLLLWPVCCAWLLIDNARKPKTNEPVNL